MTRTHPSSKVKVGLLQMASCPDRQGNLEKAREGIRQAAEQGVQILCLQELFQSQYFCQTEDEAFFDLAESIPGPSTEALSALARRHRMAMVVPLFERRAAGVYHNTAVVLDADGALLGSYRKMHIPDDPLYYEKFYFTPGDRGYPTFDTLLREHRCAGLLGSVVSGGCPTDRPGRGPDPFLSHGHRVAPVGETAIRSRPAGGLEDDSALPCHCQRDFCGIGQPSGLRAPPGERGPGVLGRLVRLRPFRCGIDRSFREGGAGGGGMRLGPD